MLHTFQCDNPILTHFAFKIVEFWNAVQPNQWRIADVVQNVGHNLQTRLANDQNFLFGYCAVI